MMNRPTSPLPMNDDAHDRRFARLFAELRDADGQDAPPFAALTSPPAAAQGRLKPSPWVLPTAYLAAAAGAAAAVLLVAPAMFRPASLMEAGSFPTDWTAPTDSLLSKESPFGSLENWRSPTDSLYDFAPTDGNT